MLRVAILGYRVAGSSLRGKSFFLGAAGLQMTALAHASILVQFQHEAGLSVLHTELDPNSQAGVAAATGQTVAPASTPITGSAVGSRQTSGPGKKYFVEQNPLRASTMRDDQDAWLEKVRGELRSTANAQRTHAVTATEAGIEAQRTSSTGEYLADRVAELYQGVFEDLLQLSGEIAIGETAGGTVVLPVYRPAPEALAMLSRWIELGLAPPAVGLYMAEQMGQMTPGDRAALGEMIDAHRAKRAAAEVDDVVGLPVDEPEEQEDEQQ